MKQAHASVSRVVAALTFACFAGALSAPARAQAPRPSAPTVSVAPQAPPIRTLRVPGDHDIEVVDGPAESRQVLLYFHGLCGDPLAFRSWRAAAARFGTLISLRGDEACPGSGGRMRWSYDHDLANRRVSAAIELVSAIRVAKGEAPLENQKLTAIGYSQGARRVEWLAARFPERYVRVAMIAGAFKPNPLPLSREGRFLLIGGTLDNHKHLYEASVELRSAGLTVLYGELPSARHGDYGPEALQAMGHGLDWLFKNVR